MHDSRKRLFAGALIVVVGLAIALAFRKPPESGMAPPIAATGFTEVVPTGPITGPHIATEPLAPRLTGRIESAVDVPASSSPDFPPGGVGILNSTPAYSTTPGKPAVETQFPSMAATLDAAKSADSALAPATDGRNLADLPSATSIAPGLQPLVDSSSARSVGFGSSSTNQSLVPLATATTSPSANSFARFPSSMAQSSDFGIPAVDSPAPREHAVWKPKQAVMPEPPRSPPALPLQLLREPTSQPATSQPATNSPALNPFASPPFTSVAAGILPPTESATSTNGVTRPIPVDRGRHRIADGDTLESIARAYYGDPNRAGEIYAVNRGILRAPDLLPIGTELMIPDAGGANATTPWPPQSAYEPPRSTPAHFASLGAGTMPVGGTVANSTVPVGWPTRPIGSPVIATSPNISQSSATPSNASTLNMPSANANDFAGGTPNADNPFAAMSGPQAGWPPKGVESGLSEGNAFTRGLSATGESLSRFGNTLLGTGTPAATGQGRNYLVRPLESWETLALRYYGDVASVKVLRAANPQLAGGPLKPGTMLVVPAK